MAALPDSDGTQRDQLTLGGHGGHTQTFPCQHGRSHLKGQGSVGLSPHSPTGLLGSPVGQALLAASVGLLQGM